MRILPSPMRFVLFDVRLTNALQANKQHCCPVVPPQSTRADESGRLQSINYKPAVDDAEAFGAGETVCAGFPARGRAWIAKDALIALLKSAAATSRRIRRRRLYLGGRFQAAPH